MKNKECFESTEIAHVWAHQKHAHGRVSGGNLSFEGTKFLSYSSVIANIIKHKGKVAVVYDAGKFSITTSGHQNMVRGAIDGLHERFAVHGGWHRNQNKTIPFGLEFTPASLRDYYLAQFKDKGEKHKLAFVNAQKIVSRGESLNEARRACAFFGLSEKSIQAMELKFRAEYAAANQLLIERRQKLDAAQAKQEATQRAAKVARAIAGATAVLAGEIKMQDCYVETSLLPDELRARFESALATFEAEKITRWQAGESIHLPSELPCFLRVVDWKQSDLSQHTNYHASNREMETSKGAIVPLPEAEKAFRFAIARRNKGWHRNGETFAVGDYQLDAINEFGICAGCHRVAWDEIIRFANTQGWIKNEK